MEYNGHKIQLDKVLGSICMNKYNCYWLMPIKNQGLNVGKLNLYGNYTYKIIIKSKIYTYQ